MRRRAKAAHLPLRAVIAAGRCLDGRCLDGYLQDAGATRTEDAFNAITLLFDAHLAH